ncbi:U3 small nucleolar RNA-associated protein [Microdochium trichocladiopsis]|uniref:U3 small nucleolar RNA-associated protein n=1 Tax=Microdochium trichocladiopsis TaxID=1682393 RepID=A0A9P8YBG7_9PEZI|nr:U3 small nucleolar RNA-associated protein [Microdochium trichocladiopsis]KAH7035316.1 U3 small nucleolar RNA-associated protein [Microdochium trichocladiopsis]
MPPTKKGKPVPEEDDDFMSSSAEVESVYGSDNDSDNEHSLPAQNDPRIFDKDSDEEELERLVLGDTANFKDALFSGEGIDGASSALGGGKGHAEGEDGDNSDSAEMDDADLFTFDVGGSKPSGGDDGEEGGLQITKGSGMGAGLSHGDPPAWEDSDDERFTISLASVSQLRKFRVSEAEDIVSGSEYIRRLRTQFLMLNPKPDWVREAEERPSKRRRRSSAAASSDDDDEYDSEARGSDSDEDMRAGDVDGAEALPLDRFLRDARALAGGDGQRSRKLRPEVIDIQRSRDIPDTHKEVVTSLSFHPEFPVLLSSSTSAIMHLHHIAPTAHPTPNPLLTSVQIKQVPVQHAEFLYPEGDRIFFAGRRRYIHSWELSTGAIQKTNKVQGHRLEQKTWERFKTSPCGRYLGLIASTRKGGGIINILNVNTMQWIAAARLDSRGGIIDFCWWSNGNGMTILGKGGQVGEFSMASRRFLGIWNDEGSTGASALALSGPGRSGKSAPGPALLGGDRWVAVGSTSGIVNIYERENLIAKDAKEDDEDQVTLKDRPTPTRTFEQLTTPCTVLTFSPDGQLLALASKHKKDALRLAHLPSCTVYRNWPTEQTPLGRISAVAFGRKSDMLAVGNDGGKVRLWEIRN